MFNFVAHRPASAVEAIMSTVIYGERTKNVNEGDYHKKEVCKKCAFYYEVEDNVESTIRNTENGV